MPVVDPRTHQPLSDDPEQEDRELAGGKREGDPGLEGATPWGGRGKHTPSEHSVAVGEKPGR